MPGSFPCFPGGFALLPHCFEQRPVALRVHWLPKSFVSISVDLVISGEKLHGFFFPHGCFVGNVVNDFGREYKVPAVNPAAVALWLFLKPYDSVPIHLDGAKTSRGLNCRDGRKFAVFFVELN